VLFFSSHSLLSRSWVGLRALRTHSAPTQYYALDLNDPACPNDGLNSTDSSSAVTAAVADLPSGAKLFVHPTEGDDLSSGDISSPLRTVQAALDLAAATEPTPAVVRCVCGMACSVRRVRRRVRESVECADKAKHRSTSSFSSRRGAHQNVPHTTWLYPTC
jgi:hypothetical protein